METSLSTLSPKAKEIVARARQENAKPFIQSLPQIKLKGSEKRIEGLTRGNYFIQGYDATTRQKTSKDIGDKPRIVILHQAWTFSQYDQDQSRASAWTSDIQGFKPTDMVTLYSHRNGGLGVEFEGAWPEFKAYKSEHYHDHEKNKSKLEFNTILYVLHEGELCRLIVRNTGVAGLAPNADTPDFKNPQDGSLKMFETQLAGAAFFEAECQLGTRFIDYVEIPFYIMTFEMMGINPKLEEHAVKWDEFKQAYGTARQSEPKRITEYMPDLEVREDIVDASALPTFD